MLFENVKRRMIAAGHLIKQAEEVLMANARKSSFYRSAIILLTTIVEGLIYEVVKKHSHPSYIISHRNEYKEKHKIPSSIFNTTNELYICERISVDMTIDDKDVGFGKLVIYLKNNRLITPAEYKLLDWARKQRNKIHIQGLNLCDTGYTRLKINKLAKIISMLIDKVNPRSP